MFFDKFRDKYSFNFLSVCGWIIFVLYLIIFSFIVLSPNEGFPALIFFYFFLLLLGLNVFFYIITFFIYVFETINFKRITNEKVLNNKFIKIFQISGIVLAFLPLITIMIVLITGFTKDLVYSI